MRTSLIILGLTAVLGSCATPPTPSESSSLQAALESVGAKLDSFDSVAGYSAFASGANLAASKYAITQTSFPVDSTAYPSGESDNIAFELGYIQNAVEFAQSQTFITGAAKASITSVAAEYLSIMSEIVAISLPEETGAVGGKTTLDTISKPSGAATQPKTSAVSSNAAAQSSAAAESAAPTSGAQGKAVIGALAGILAGFVAAVIVL